jgi:hypothetical protein
VICQGDNGIQKKAQHEQPAATSRNPSAPDTGRRRGGENASQPDQRKRQFSAAQRKPAQCQQTVLADRYLLGKWRAARGGLGRVG